MGQEIWYGYALVPVAALVTTGVYVRLAQARHWNLPICWYVLGKAVFSTIAGYGLFVASIHAVGVGDSAIQSAVRGVAAGAAGCGVANLPIIRNIQLLLDRRIEGVVRFDDQFQVRKTARKLDRGFTPECVIELYRHTLSQDDQLGDDEVRALVAQTSVVLDQTESSTIVMGAVVRRIKEHLVEHENNNDPYESFVTILLLRSRRRRLANRARLLLRRQPVRISDAKTIVS